MANARVTQAPVLVLGVGSSSARITQSPVLVLGVGSSSARITQSTALVLALTQVTSVGSGPGGDGIFVNRGFPTMNDIRLFPVTLARAFPT